RESGGDLLVHSIIKLFPQLWHITECIHRTEMKLEFIFIRGLPYDQNRNAIEIAPNRLHRVDVIWRDHFIDEFVWISVTLSIRSIIALLRALEKVAWKQSIFNSISDCGFGHQI